MRCVMTCIMTFTGNSELRVLKSEKYGEGVERKYLMRNGFGENVVIF